MIEIFELTSPISKELLLEINKLRYLISLQENSILIKGKTQLDEIKINNENFLFLAKDKNKVCGYSTLTLSKHEFQPTENIFEPAVFVHPDWQGKGVGKSLLMKLISFAEKNPKISTLSGYVKKTNRASKGLCDSQGFSIVQDHNDYWILHRKTSIK